MNKENSNNPTKKRAKNINREFRDAQPHFKYYRMSIKLAEKKKKYRKPDSNNCWQNVEKQELSNIAGGTVN